MKVLRKFLKHKFIIGTLFMIVSIVALVTALIPVLSADIKIDNTQVNTSDKDLEGKDEAPTSQSIEPQHDYTSITASIATGAKIFAGITTARDLKNNLKVTGTFMSGSSSVSVPLKQSEYFLQVAIESYTHELLENDIVLNEMPEASQSIHIIVKVKKSNGEIEASISIPLSSVADSTEYEELKNITTITVDNISSLSSDHDKESIKELLVVKDGEGNIIANKELYDITSLDALNPGSTASFTVSYTLGEGVTATGQILDITQADLLAADFSVNSEYRLNGMYYQKRSEEPGEEDKWFSAFVTQANGITGSTMQDIYGDGLKITVYYPNSSRTLSFSTIGENFAIADSNEYVVFNNTTFVENNNDITAQVSSRSGKKSVTASISINFELAKIVEIKATGFNEDAAGLTSSGNSNNTFFTKPGGNESYIITRANTGVWNENNYLSSSQFTVSGTLNPTAEVIAATSSMSDEELASYYYDKEVTIIYSADNTITTKYPVRVKYVKPTSWNSVGIANNKFPDQTMRMPFNYGDLYVNMKWNNTTRQVPLTDFLDKDGNSQHIMITLYSDLDGSVELGQYIGETPVITKDVSSILVQFRYNITEDSWNEGAFSAVPELTIKKYVVTLPSFDTRSISFSSNAIKTILFDNSIEDDILSGITLNVSDSPDFSGTSAFAEFNANNLTKIEDIKFLAGGKKYYIELKISDALEDEVEWASGEGVTGTAIRYTVEISKGPINPVIVSYQKGTWIYGDKPETPIITGTRVDGSSLSILYGDQASDISSNVLYAKYVINYYRKTETGYELVDLAKETLVVGEYYVQVYIPDTINYLEAYSTPRPGYGCPTVTITPAPLSPNDLLPNITFDGISRDGDDFVTGVTGIKYGDSDVVIAKDLTSLTAGIPLSSDKKALHAGKYSVKLSIADAYKNNYTWADDVNVNSDNTVTKEFEINKRTLGYDILNKNSLGFVYGADTLPAPTFGYSDSFNPNSPTFEVVKPKYFFAEEGTVKYYDSSNNEVLAAEFNTWPAGTYTVKRELSAAVGHLESDYTLPTASATFIVEQKEIERIETASDSAIYNGDIWQYAIAKWNSGLDNSGSPILTGVLEGKPFKNDGTLDVDSALNLANFDTAFDSSTGTINVLHAGVYTFTITLNSNYKWKTESVMEKETPSDTPVITLTMNQKILQGSLTTDDNRDYTWDSNVFTFNPESTVGQQTPTITMTGIALADNITLNYTLHYSSDDTLITAENKHEMIAADYYYLLTGWTGDSNAAGYNLANNYQFPADRKIIVFTVASAALKDVQLSSSLQGEYKGNAFNFADFITNLSEYTYGANHASSKILYYVVSDASNHEHAENLNGEMLPLLTDTGTYHIYIYPNTNFDWENKSLASFGASAPIDIQDKKGFVATFTITPKALMIEDILWGSTTFTYNGLKQTPTPSIDENKLLNASDQADVKLKDITVTADTSDGITAGTYTAVLNGFLDSSIRAFNYTISDFTKEITINPYELDAPTMSTKTGVFTGFNQALDVTLPLASSVTGYDATTIIAGNVLGGWDSLGSTAHGASYNLGVFTYSNAGTYSLTFTLTDTQNYKWKQTGTEVVIQDIKIERMKITAPALGDSRTIEFDGFAKKPSFQETSYVIVDGTQYYLNADGLGVDILGHQITWTIQFAEYDKEAGFAYITSTIEPINYGVYYLEFNILDSKNQSHLNYEWVRNDADTDKLQFLTDSGWGEVERDAIKGTALFLAYMITRKVFQPTLEILNGGKYIFGNNGVEELFTQNTELGNKNNFIHLADSDDATTVLDSEPIISYKIYQLNSLNDQFSVDEAIEITDLVNGLPWNKGYYGIRVLIEFPDSYQFQSIPLTLSFEVEARNILVNWTSKLDLVQEGSTTDWSMTYTSNTYQPDDLLSATITNLAKKDATDVPVAPTYEITSNPSLVRDAKTYTFTLTITGTDENSKNYNVLSTEESISTSLEITPVTLNLSGTPNVTSIEYGLTPSLSGTSWWSYQAGSAQVCDNDDPETVVTYEIINPVENGKYTVGTYEFKIKVANGITNYIISDSTTNGSLNITAREITLLLDDSDNKTTSVYQQAPISLGTPYTVNHGVDENVTDWLVSGDILNEIFTLALFDKVGNNVTLETYNSVGIYEIRVIKGKDKNYIVHVIDEALNHEGDTAKLGDYTITEAELTVESILGNVDRNTTITYDANPYDWIKDSTHQERPSLIAYTGLKGVNLEDNNVSWTITKKNTLDIVSGSITNAFTQTTYIVTASASNHSSTEEVEVVVEIEKAVLILSVDFVDDNALFYGEALPNLNTDLNENIYTIEGLKGEDDRGVIQGTFTYSSSDYAVWNAIGFYTTSFDVDYLTADNYTFEAKAGRIEVKELPIEIFIPNLSNVYIQDVSQKEASDTLIVDAFIELYEKLIVTIDPSVNGRVTSYLKADKNIYDIVTLMTNALIIDDSGNVIATNDVANYTLYLVESLEENSLFANYDISVRVEENTLDAPNNALDGKTAVFVIMSAVNVFTNVFGFEGVEDLTNTEDIVVKAWVYGVNATDGYDAETHKIKLPTAKFNSVPGEEGINTDVLYHLSYKDVLSSNWILLGAETTDIISLFASVLSLGQLNATTYKVEYTLKGNSNYEDATDVRYFKVDPRDLYVWAKDAATYYGEDFSRAVETFGLVDNGCGTVDVLSDVLSVTYEYEYIAGSSDADSYTYTTNLDSENIKYSNYVLHWNATLEEAERKGTLTVLPRPIVIEIDEKTSKYDFNKASDVQDEHGEILTFNASLGDNTLGITFANQNPFIGIHGTSFDNDTQNIIKLFTNALLEGVVETQNVGNYGIFAAYADANAKKNYAITVQTIYNRDIDLENRVNDYFTTEDLQYTFYETYLNEYYAKLSSNYEMISVQTEANYLAGTYCIISANLKLTLIAPNATYDGLGKEVEIEGYGQNDPYGQIAYKAQYDYGNNTYLDAAPINVGTYPVRIVVDNPNYAFDAGSQGTRVRITERELDWTADINDSGNYAESNNYGNDRTIYLGVGNRNKLVLKFGNSIYTNTGVVAGDGKDARLNFDITVNGKAIDQTAMSLATAYTDSFVSYSYDVDLAIYELTAQHSGVYTVCLTLSGTEASNYKFPNAYLKPNTTDTYEFTFTIKRAVKTATRAQNTTIQYGTPVSLDGSTSNSQLFGGFTLDQATLNLLNAENGQLMGSADASKVTYSVPDYDSKLTGANERCYILPSGLVLYNYDVQYSNIGVMTVQQREIVVVVRGAETNNSFASVTYTGELQGPDLTSEESSWAYFAPKDLDGNIKWYGDAVQDKDANFATLFNVSLDLYGDGSFGVNSGKGLNANTYYINIHRGNLSTNYDVTFQNSKGKILDEYPSTDLGIAPQFKIIKKNLIVQAGSTGLNHTESFVTSFTIPYGNLLEKTDSTYYYLTSQFEGLVEEDNTDTFISTINAKLTYTTSRTSGDGEDTYIPWDSHAGAIYTILPNEIEFENYQVTQWRTAQMEVVSRLVIASTEDRTYTEHIDNGIINYHMGVEGTYHAAQVVFRDYDSSLYNTVGFDKFYTNGKIDKDQYGVINSGVITKYAPKHTTSYRNLEDSDEVIHADGPRKAGVYTATVSITSNKGNYDYKIVTGNETDVKTVLAYTVHKKKLSINWNEVSSDYLNYNTGDDKYRDIENYINEIMNVSMINRQYTSSSAEQVIEHLTEALSSSNLSDGRYYINTREGKVTLKIYGVGLYTATISIANSAIRNYEWRDMSGASGAEFTLAFRVAASSVTIDRLEFEYGSWIYGNFAPEVTFETNVQGVGLLYKYARIDSIPNDFTSPVFGEMITDKNLTDYLNKNNYGYSPTMPTDAGTYLMCAWYPGSDQYQMSEAFLVFEITKAPIKSPDLINTDYEFIEEDGKKIIEMVYTGETLYLELGYDTKLLDISYAGSMSAPTAGKGMILHAKDVLDGGYSISFSLSDDSNYTWDEASVGEYVWRILPAADNEITAFDTQELVAGLTYGDNYMDPSAISKYGDSVRIEYCIDELWGTTRPTQAGTYKVRAISPATKNYYSGTIDTDAISEEISFTIHKAELYVLASGSMIYGDTFSSTGGRDYTYQFAGFLNNDTASLVTVGDIEYMLIQQPDKLEVGKYALQLAEENGAVIGMTADNYTIIATEGTFTVQKKAVTVVLGDAQSVYGEKIDLSKVSMVVLNNELVDGDSLADLNIELSIDSARVDMESSFNSATSYKVNAEGYSASKNYNVTVFGSGVYTIMPLNIYITVEAGGGVYQGQINPVKLTGVYAADDNRNILEEFAPEVAPKIRFNYWGSSNDGNWSHTNADMWPSEPMLAGNYHATAVATQTNNYMLVTNMGTPSVSFVVERKVLDDTDRDSIYAEAIEYTGNPITPIITDHNLEGLYHTKQVSFENVGSYFVPLTLKDAHNYRWASVDGDTCEIPFEIVRGYNTFESEVSIADWVYGAYDPSKNLPNAEIRFGSANDFTFSYATSQNGEYTPNIPTQAGTYWVRITAPQTDNYYAVTSEAKEFHITKATVSAPSIVIVYEGEGKNTTYTGSRLQAVISGYDPAIMRMIYDGDSSVGNVVAIYGLEAKTYMVSFALNDSTNYTWDSNTTIENEQAILQWKVGRKQLAKPTMNTSMFMVNGGTLTFIPVGFDEETMEIEGNKTSYGGSFKVTVTIKDTQNYEWIDGTVDEVIFDWFVVGWDTVFIIVVSVIGIIAAIAGIAIVIQYALHKRKKKKELEDELAVQGLMVDEVSPVGEPSDKASAKTNKPEAGGKNNE